MAGRSAAGHQGRLLNRAITPPRLWRGLQLRAAASQGLAAEQQRRLRARLPDGGYGADEDSRLGVQAGG